MTLKERNDMLRLSLYNINYSVTQNAGNNPTDVEKQYDCNSVAFDAITKVVTDCIRAGLPGSDLPPKTYFTPEAAKKVIDPVFMNPPLQIFRYSQMKSMPRGIEMKEFVHADGSIDFVGQYINKKNAQPNSRPKRTYRISLRNDESDWFASAWEDDTRLFDVSKGTKWNTAYAALGALRGILHKRCTATRGNRRRKAFAKLAAAAKEEV